MQTFFLVALENTTPLAPPQQGVLKCASLLYFLSQSKRFATTNNKYILPLKQPLNVNEERHFMHLKIKTVQKYFFFL